MRVLLRNHGALDERYYTRDSALTRLRFAQPPSPTRGEGKIAPHGSIEIGEKSMNQLFGWITPFTFGLIARGPTS
jgi:hypothetical protein